MDEKNKKNITISMIILILGVTVFWIYFLSKKVSDKNLNQSINLETTNQADDKIKMLRAKLFSGKTDEIINEVETELKNSSEYEFPDREKYQGMQKIYLAFAYGFEDNHIEVMKNLKEVVESSQYHADQRALAAQEIANRLISFNNEDAEKQLFQDGELKKCYVAGNVNETIKNIHGLSISFRPTPLSSYALSDYDYEKASWMKEDNLIESEKIAKVGAERLTIANNLYQTMKTDEWVYDRSIKSQIYKARIHEKIIRFNLNPGKNKIFNNDDIELIYKDILKIDSGTKMINNVILAKLYYAIFLNNYYGYENKKTEIDSLMDVVKENVNSDNYAKGFRSFLEKERMYPNNYYKKSEIIDLANKSAGLRDVLKKAGWQDQDLQPVIDKQ